MIKREIYEAAGGLDPRFPGEEERDLYVRIHDLGHQVWYIHKLMSSHYDFKQRGWRYLLFTDVAGAILVPLMKSVGAGNMISYIYVYRRLLPVLLTDIFTFVALMQLSATGIWIAVGLQSLTLIYVYLIKRPGYFIIWKSALLNFHRAIRILRRDVRCAELVSTNS